LPLGVGYVGLVVSTVGLFDSYWRRAPHMTAVASVLPLAFAVVYFTFVANQSSLVFGRYLLPLAPMFALGMGVGLTWLADWLTRRVPAMRATALPLVFVVVAGPFAAAAVSWNLRHAAPITLDQAARWVAGRTTPGDIVVIEGASFVVPPRITLKTVNRLIDKPIDAYRAEGVRYLVASTDVTEAYSTNPAAMDLHKALFGGLEIVQTYPPTAARGGPTLTIFRIAE
jgi:hypothetical protein